MVRLGPPLGRQHDDQPDAGDRSERRTVPGRDREASSAARSEGRSNRTRLPAVRRWTDPAETAGRSGTRGRGLRHIVRACVLAVALAVITLLSGSAQESFSTGQNIAPAYEGWEKNADGSFNLVFGYFNRNWDEEIDTPIGAANAFEPGDPDRGQPTHL